MLQNLNLLLKQSPFRPLEVGTAHGPFVDAAAYTRNLQQLVGVLPPRWGLCAVQKWDALGHSIDELAPAAAVAGAAASGVLFNWEARTAVAAGGPKRLLRMKPATYQEAREAAEAGWGMEELVGPDNLQDVAAAACDSGRPIGVHLYLFRHYEDCWGWEPEDSRELQDLVSSLKPGQLAVRGIMAHPNPDHPDEQKDELVRRFLSLACPVAAALAPARVVLHWADSTEVLRLLGPDGRMHMPTGTGGWDRSSHSSIGKSTAVSADGNGSNIEFWARVGKLAYGPDPKVNRQLGGRVAPVMRWEAPVAHVQWEDVVGHRRLVATVDLSHSQGRFPAPSWWAGCNAYAASNLNDYAEPAAFVSIHGQCLRLAAVPRGDGRLLRVDVTDAELPVRPGDMVCLLGQERGLQDLATEMGADWYNAALCLRGAAPMEGSDWWPPACNLPF